MNLLSTTFDCTKYAQEKYEAIGKYFIGFDVRSVHILRFISGINGDYEEDEDSTIFEHELIDYGYDLIDYFEENYDIKFPETADTRKFMDFLQKKMEMKDILKAIVDLDIDEKGMENWEYVAEYCDLDTMVDEYALSDGSILSDITI